MATRSPRVRYPHLHDHPALAKSAPHLHPPPPRSHSLSHTHSLSLFARGCCLGYTTSATDDMPSKFKEVLLSLTQRRLTEVLRSPVHAGSPGTPSSHPYRFGAPFSSPSSLPQWHLVLVLPSPSSLVPRSQIPTRYTGFWRQRPSWHRYFSAGSAENCG